MPDPFATDLATAARRRSLKWRRYAPDVIPLWVAEMDFPLAPAVRAALEEQITLGDFGYPPEPPPMATSEFREAVAGWMHRRHGWAVAADMVSIVPDTMRGIEIAIERFSERGDPIALSDPVYYPFREAIETASRVPLWIPMVRHDLRWELDLDAVAQAFARPEVKVFLHCTPHNPTGTVFSASEQQAIAELAERHDVLVVSDEVHADLAYGSEHVPFATVTPTIAERTITASAASKAFNFAGLRCGYAIAGSPRLHAEIQGVPIRERKLASLPGYAATIASYSGGEPWLEALHRHLAEMRDLAIDRLASIDPSLIAARPDASYLLWTDWRALDLGANPVSYLLERARVALSDGAAFGPSGHGFVRLNFGTSRSILDQALERIADAVS